MLIQIWSLIRFFLRQVLSLIRVVLSLLQKAAGPIDRVLDNLGAGYLLYFLPGSCSQLGRVYWLIFIGAIAFMLLWLTVTILGCCCGRFISDSCADFAAGTAIVVLFLLLTLWFIGPLVFLRLIFGVDQGSY